MHTVLKALLVAAVATTSLTGMAQTRDYDGRYSVDSTELDTRIDRQQVRIERGIQRGLITRSEAWRLMNEHRQIERAQARAKADGRVSRWEADRLTAMLNRADDHIRALRRNLDEAG